MIKMQLIDAATKIYKAYKVSDNSSVKFKFFTNYRLGNAKLKIFDFSEFTIFHEDYEKFIITRLNEYTNEIEIHCADVNLILKKLNQRIISDSTPLEIQSVQKESIEGGVQKFKKIISINGKDDHFIIILIDRLLIYSFKSLCGTSNEKATPYQEIFFQPILVSYKPYVSCYDDEKVYLFQKNGTYKNKTNQIQINYKVIDCKNSERPQLNQKIIFPSPIVAQSTETMLSYVEQVKIYEKQIFQLKIYTEFKKKVFKQVIIVEPGQSITFKKQKEYLKQTDVGQILQISKKDIQSKQ
ncbi:unnamed protein product [Paramecium pentaurelia]|uniref:Uncharacterized protein n=1 Tax=Paramecium pentaurelia TaxID=43138 RepID=A0A8S1RVI4_9CILI|nr:unnamed protein product [Paramecium pentaurelia]